MIRIVFPLVCMMLAACPPAAGALPQDGSATDGDGWGIVTSQPITVAGHEFCRYFIAAWLDQPGSDRYTIAIRERPSARSGTQVWIEHGQRRVLQVQLPPARSDLQALGENAAANAYQAVLDIARQRTYLREPDLAPDEF